MHTFGREREKEYAAGLVCKPEDVRRVHALVDAIHDLIDGHGTRDQVFDTLRECLISGGSGCWEGAGSWVRKLAADVPGVQDVWVSVVSHRSASVRFRAAAHIASMPPDMALRVGCLLLRDPGVKVRAKAADELSYHPAAAARDALEGALGTEAAPLVLDSIRYALAERDERLRGKHAIR